jgi:hypothetical protein
MPSPWAWASGLAVGNNHDNTGKPRERRSLDDRVNRVCDKPRLKLDRNSWENFPVEADIAARWALPDLVRLKD